MDLHEIIDQAQRVGKTAPTAKWVGDDMLVASDGEVLAEIHHTYGSAVYTVSSTGKKYIARADAQRAAEAHHGVAT